MHEMPANTGCTGLFDRSWACPEPKKILGNIRNACEMAVSGPRKLAKVQLRYCQVPAGRRTYNLSLAIPNPVRLLIKCADLSPLYYSGPKTATPPRPSPKKMPSQATHGAR